MDTLEATSELQSRLASLSFSSFPGITSQQCDDGPVDGWDLLLTVSCLPAATVSQSIVLIRIYSLCFCHHLISVVFSRLQSTDLSLSKNPTDMDETKQDPGLPSEVQWLIFTDLWKYAFVHWQTKMQLYSNVIFSNNESCMCAFEG